MDHPAVSDLKVQYRGDAAKLFEGWEMIHAIAPDLLLYGVALAYTNHHIEHGE